MALIEKIYVAPENSPEVFLSGGFGRQVMILMASEPGLDAQNKGFLAKILQAVSLDLEKDTLTGIFMPLERFSLAVFARNRQAAHILVFGLDPLRLGLRAQIHPYEPLQFYGATWLFAEKLSVIEPDRQRKGMLWQALKTMYA